MVSAIYVNIEIKGW